MKAVHLLSQPLTALCQAKMLRGTAFPSTRSDQVSCCPRTILYISADLSARWHVQKSCFLTANQECLPRPKVEHFALSRQKLPINRIGWLDWWREADKSDGAKQQIGLSGGDLGGLFCFLWLLMCSLLLRCSIGRCRITSPTSRPRRGAESLARRCHAPSRQNLRLKLSRTEESQLVWTTSPRRWVCHSRW